MKPIKTRRIRRQCLVPGCKNTDSYMVHRTNEPWPTVIMCKECAEDLYKALCTEADTKKEANPEVKTETAEADGKSTKKAAPKKAEGK